MVRKWEVKDKVGTPELALGSSLGKEWSSLFGIEQVYFIDLRKQLFKGIHSKPDSKYIYKHHQNY